MNLVRASATLVLIQHCVSTHATRDFTVIVYRGKTCTLSVVVYEGVLGKMLSGIGLFCLFLFSSRLAFLGDDFGLD